MLARENNRFNEAPLFEYLEERQNEESATKATKSQRLSLRRFYAINFSLSLMVILSICCMFYTQFQVDNMQHKVDLVQVQIDDYEDEIKALSVEWYYLTRPDRLRILAKEYLKDNNNIAFNQVKDYDQLQKFYLANLKNHGNVNDIVVSQLTGY